ncbi:MAG: hypothetical protein ABR543_11515 [Gemmatimonadaceae bacterium]
MSATAPASGDKIERGVFFWPSANSPVLPARTEATQWTVLWLLIGIALLHTVMTWHHGSIYWGDQGRWLHEVERFAEGETLYRDYAWPFPPLAMWLVGGAAKWFGSGVSVVWSVTAAIYVLIAIAYFRYVTLLVRRPLALYVAGAGFLLATAYANQGSAPLPTGMYTPAAPIGFLLLLIATILTLEFVRSPSAGYVAGAGLFCGLCILTKQDFWLPALFLIGAGGTLLIMGHTSARRLAGILGAVFLVTVSCGATVVGEQAGWHVLGSVATGFGHAQEFSGAGLPTWERLTVQVAAVSVVMVIMLSFLVAVGATTGVRSRRLLATFAAFAFLAFAVHVYMSFRIGGGIQITDYKHFRTPTELALASHVANGDPLLRPALGWFRQRLQSTIPPILLPLGLLVAVAARWNRHRTPILRNVVMFLLVLCLAARARRGFALVEWFHVLLELPVYVLAVQLFLGEGAQRRIERALRIMMLVLVVLAAHAYWNLGIGPLTQRATERVRTPKGIVHLRPNAANHYRRVSAVVDRLDPSHSRTLFAFGYSGGFNYFLDRPNPTPATLGFRLAVVGPDSVLATLLREYPAPLLLDNLGPFARTEVPRTTLEPGRWEFRVTANHYMRVDRRYFQAALAACDVATPHSLDGPDVVYDCQRVREARQRGR